MKKLVWIILVLLLVICGYMFKDNIKSMISSEPQKEAAVQEEPTLPEPAIDVVAASGFNNGTKVVRGVNICPLTAKKIADGDDPKGSVNQPLSALSVNASNSLSYASLAANLPQAHYAFATLGDLRKGNKHLQIVKDPLPGNPYHCLISVITPNEMARTKIGGNCK